MEEPTLSGRGLMVGGAIILALCLSNPPQVPITLGWLSEDSSSQARSNRREPCGPHATMRFAPRTGVGHHAVAPARRTAG